MDLHAHRVLSDARPEIPRTSWSLVDCFWCGRPRHGARPPSVGPTRVAKYATIRLLEMGRFYPLRDEAIDNALTRRAPGNYALGYVDGGTFNVFYVGRSDFDLARRLHDWVGMPSRDERYRSAAQASWQVRCGARLPLDTPSLGRVGTTESGYTHFAYSYTHCAEEAYAKEWRNYDAFGGSRNLDNVSHPVPVLEESSYRPRLTW